MKINTKLKILILLFFIGQLLTNCGQQVKWYRGNTHAHTVICGHADSPPEVVAKWYLDHGYNFLILSEHNHFINPDSVVLPENYRKDFILIPGEEVTGPKIIHSTAMNTHGLVLLDEQLEKKSEIIQNHVDITLDAGGHTILNHPNYYYTVQAEDVLAVNNLYMFELYNGHPAVHNFGDSDHPATEELWDELLTKGMKIYGVSSDDAHHFSKIDTIYSNPGRGWVMVQAAELSPKAITSAMLNGHFYASNGVILNTCHSEDGIYYIQIDQEKTLEQLTDENLHGRRVKVADKGFFIDFIGPQGTILSTSEATEARFNITDSYPYVRVKVTYRRQHPVRGMEEFYAWGQPVFTDKRKNNL